MTVLGATLALMGFCALPATAIAPTTTSVACQPASLTVGASTTCTSTVSNGTATAPTGSVTLTSDTPGTGGTCTLIYGSCQITYTPTAVGNGTHELIAAYGGDAGDAASQGTTAVTVALNPPVLTLNAPDRERMARSHEVSLILSTDTDATFVAHGTLTVPGAARVFHLRGVTGTLTANTPKTIQLGLSVKQAAAVKLALKHHRKVTALATVRVRNGGGPTTLTRTIRAKR